MQRNCTSAGVDPMRTMAAVTAIVEALIAEQDRGWQTPNAR